MKRMFVLKESKDSSRAWVFLSEPSRKSGIYFVFCVTEHLRRMVCSVLEINICSQDLQYIIIYKTITKNFTAINKGYFKSDCNPFQKQPPDVFYKKAVLKKFCNIPSKTPVLESLFNKIEDLQVCNFIKKRLQHRWFPVNIAKLLRKPISKNIWKMFGYKKKSLKCVIVNFHVFMRKLVPQMCAEQLISGVEFQISQNNRHEIYPEMIFISFLNM